MQRRVRGLPGLDVGGLDFGAAGWAAGWAGKASGGGLAVGSWQGGCGTIMPPTSGR